MEDWQQCSSILSHILDNMGYCGWIINNRRDIYNKRSEYFSKVIGRQVLISGSKAEGLSHDLQSDFDTLFFMDYICGTFENDSDDTTRDPTRYMFRVEKECSPPGYCMLIVATRPTRPIKCNDIENCLSATENDAICLHSERLLCYLNEGLGRMNLSTKPVTGPSLPNTFRDCFDYDNVPTISCPCSAELSAWYKRPRHHDWPSQSLQDDVVSTPANIVAVGSKDGKFGHMEWRFCFNRAELKLKHSLNTTQNKLYVVLKMILKDYLKPENKEITSYVLKNIVFWICEKNPSSLFTPCTLLSWIYVGLQTLKGHIVAGNLPYYMIPGRNLLHGKFADEIKKSAFLEKLTHLMESGVCIVHVCETIKLGLDLYNEGMLEDYGWKRNLTEIYTFHLEDSLPANVKTKCELLAGIKDPAGRILGLDLKTVIKKGVSLKEYLITLYYCQGLFLNPEKAEVFAKADIDSICKRISDLTGIA